MQMTARDAAIERIAFVFKKDASQIEPAFRFDKELKAKASSDFAYNEFDRLSEDVQQMLTANVGSPDRDDVSTVQAFCDLVERYERADPDGWKAMLLGWHKEQRMDSAPKWRRAVWRLVGV